MMSHVVIVGCGVVGAAIAYELSQNPTLRITVLDKQSPAQASTSAALGVLMGAISQKKKGRAWTMRDASIRRYESLIPELEAKTGMSVPYNQDGIVLLRFEGEDDEKKWHALATLRQSQGWQLNLWDAETLRSHCPYVGTHLGDRPIIGAIHSVHDRQLDPVALTHALIAAAKINGVTFHFDAPVSDILPLGDGSSAEGPYRIAYGIPDDHSGGIQPEHAHAECDRPAADSSTHVLDAVDHIILSTGLGTFPLTQSMGHTISPDINPVDIRPVAGQALRIRLPEPLSQSEESNSFHPVVSGSDIHIVPVKQQEYWVGATVEFPTDESIQGAQNVDFDASLLTEVLQGAFDLCPMLATGTIVHEWVGYRPRPWNRPAPVIESLDGHPNIILATGHYRNGILLAPATAQRVSSMIAESSAQPA